MRKNEDNKKGGGRMWGEKMNILRQNKDKVLEMIKRGESYSNIGRIFGVSKSTVRRFCLNELGVESKHKPFNKSWEHIWAWRIAKLDFIILVVFFVFALLLVFLYGGAK